MAQTLLAQVREVKPDVVHIQCTDLIHSDVAKAVKQEVRLVVGQIAADLPRWDYRPYDLVVSSVPGLVDRFHQDGIDAEWLPLAFEASLIDRVPETARDVPVSFVGSFSISHPRRLEVLEAVARATSLSTWTGDADRVPSASPVRPTIQGAAWGRGMYEVLGRSRITVNNHARIAGSTANNLRLFEATGMGALLVTEAASNLAQLFEAGQEVATYRSPRGMRGSGASLR